ncbi:hypothetical protein [Nocardia lasii]|uniref:VCBS repeat-containing protein n=1 Tax=Nocardia lasii TaxID=1616107 RepID=A0ABW1JNP2_9NOCA
MTGCLPEGDSPPSRDSLSDPVNPADYTGQDPCAGRNGIGRMCRVVAVAPISGTDAVNPIAIALSTAPSYELLVGLPDTVARYSSSLGDYYEASDGLGPEGTFVEKQEKGLVAATDLSGDGVPELIFWIGGVEQSARYRVLTVVDGALRIVAAPGGQGMYSDAETWAIYGGHGANYGAFRCAPDQPGTITRLGGDSIGDTAASGYELDHHFRDANTWQQGTSRDNQPIPAYAHAALVPFDCPHTERRVPAGTTDKTDPFHDSPADPATPAQPCAGLTLPDGRAAEIRALTGEITCARAEQIYTEYRDHPPATAGNTNWIATPDWICSTPTAGTNTRTGRVASCADGTAVKTWTFEVHLVQ